MSQCPLEYFHGAELPAQVWTDKYALRDPDDKVVEATPDDMHRRMAREFARVERVKFKHPLTEDEIYELFKGFGPIIPQGSPMYGIGNPRPVSLSNCFVTGTDPVPCDSYGGIMRVDEHLVQISKRRGGVGTDLSHIRPAELPTNNSSRKATGVVPIMRRYSNTIREVGQSGRRGALLLSISVHHPEVLEFSRIKLDPKEVTGANVSVRLTDEFLKAVRADGEYEQRWPVDSAEPVIRRTAKARDVWMAIIAAAHARAEPGLLFWDNILRESPADCYAKHGFRSISCNPCAELILCLHDSCRLLLVNLFSCVVDPFAPQAHFDWAALTKYARLAQRLMDDLVDLELEMVDRIIAKVESDPEPEPVKRPELELWRDVRKKCELGRRTGTGQTALGDAMAAVGIRYGSDESIAFAERVYRTLKLGAYRESVEMARELGPFPVWDPALEKDNPFLNRIRDEDPDLYADMQRVGRRNIALLTTAPTGSVSLLAGPDPKYAGTTSGIEPLFVDAPYVRRKKVNHGDKAARVDFTDVTGDQWTHHEVFHPKLKQWMDVTGETDWRKSPYRGCCAEDLDWRKRVRLQAAAGRHLDHSISSTLNVPADITVEQVAVIYETAWEEGCKGITVYRKGCRDGVLVDKPTPSMPKTNSPKRPRDLPCDVHHTRIKGNDHFVVIGLLEGHPYEVFAGADPRGIFKNVEKGRLRKVSRGHYDLIPAGADDTPRPDIASLLTDEQEAVTRLTSTALRHGAPLVHVVEQLSKVRGDLTGFARAVGRVLRRYVADGAKVSGTTCEKCGGVLIFQEGCQRCQSCGASRCQ